MWRIEDHELAALAEVSRDRRKEATIDHVRAKLVLPEGVDEKALKTDLGRSYDLAERFLAPYPEASYKSYVFMALVFTLLKPEVMSSPEPRVWLNNRQIGINTRVDLAYRIMKATVNGGL